ncbi:glycosyltransferase family 2 protein [Geobacter sp. SVR]|uniref:glycosyltransferase family 2 protein n=1 Tax=Geobacter sp. SVR TaxID=2495594 RepID=UPI00143EF9E1|nr:glycosyltransferase family 2 protein [Geobacter sp. SVR]BCS55989.1 hypothetical protein GSVR_42970 [Geobacter sp. SVR]GCF84752.1 hypothetical protein GSbR_13520 [Geobacter sp. SVR]
MINLEDPALIARFNAVAAATEPLTAMSTPIFINCFNRVTPLRRLVDWLLHAGQQRIVLLDNVSTYPPLLRYYEELGSEPRVTVVRLPLNFGHVSLWACGILHRLNWSQPYVYTDPDVLPDDNCPKDFIGRFATILGRHPTIMKAGFGLIIDDLPDCYRFRNEVQAWEKQFWDIRVATDEYLAPIDTTFALYRGGNIIWDQPTFEAAKHNAVRTGAPYLARHLDWYIDSDHPSTELEYYRAHTLPGATSWSLEALPANVAHDIEMARRGARMIRMP